MKRNRLGRVNDLDIQNSSTILSVGASTHRLFISESHLNNGIASDGLAPWPILRPSIESNGVGFLSFASCAAATCSKGFIPDGLRA